jgi:hypothetical protein
MTTKTLGQIAEDAVTFAEAFVPNEYQTQNAADYAEAYAAGARQVLQYLEQFAARVNAVMPFESSSEFEKGQVDGILWTLDALNALFGRD